MIMSNLQALRSCLHTHCTFCDGRADIEAMCEAAFARGFTSIGFSSHAPITKKTGIVTSWIMQDHLLDKYIDEVLAARKRWEGKLSVFLGLEVDYIHGYCGPADPDIQALPLDYILGAVHYVTSPKSGEPYNADEFPETFGNVLDEFDHNGRALCEAYYTVYNSMINAGGYDILAHLDLIKKNNDQYSFFLPDENWYKELLVKTVDTIAINQNTEYDRRKTVVEVNTGGVIRNYNKEPYPSLYILKLLNERDIPLTISADAHAEDQLGGAYDLALELILKSGYSAVSFLERNATGKAVWQEEMLSL